jgi:hypothetical protein
MTSRPDWQPAQVRALLQARGYDVDPTDTRYGDNSITARRERGGFVHLVAVDRGGRFRAELTVATGETRRSTTIGAVPVVVVAQNQRTLTVTGSLPSWNHLAAVLTQLDTML